MYIAFDNQKILFARSPAVYYVSSKFTLETGNHRGESDRLAQIDARS